MKQRAAASKSSSAKPKLNFFSDTVSELKKVTWLSRREIIYLSGIVLLVTLVVGVILALVDFGFTNLIAWGFLNPTP